MATQYVGEIKPVGFNFAPQGWAMCNGAIMAISQNEALYQLIGTTYGGDGKQTFALPNLQSRVPIHVGPGYVLGQQGGVEAVTLSVDNMAQHTHAVFTAQAATSTSPVGHYPAASTTPAYVSGTPNNLRAPRSARPEADSPTKTASRSSL